MLVGSLVGDALYLTLLQCTGGDVKGDGACTGRARNFSSISLGAFQRDRLG